MDTRTAAVLNDLQMPFHDTAVVRLVLNFLKELRPETVILNGDIVDMYSISEFDRDPLTEARLEEEIGEASWLMDALAHVPVKIWIGGNHEDRLRRYLWRHAQAFAGLADLAFDKLFRLADFGFEWLEYGEYCTLGKLLVTHGDIVRKVSGASARAHFEKYGTNVLIGHTHRLGTYYKTHLNHPSVAYENGCLCSLAPEYISYPDWQHGFSVVHYDDSGYFNVQQIPVFIRDGRPAFYYGKDYIQ